MDTAAKIADQRLYAQRIKGFAPAAAAFWEASADVLEGKQRLDFSAVYDASCAETNALVLSRG